MEIIVLGSGTITPSLERNASGLAVRCAESLILVDMGPGTMRRMCEAGIDARLVDAILLTHFHPDHVSDLVPFLFAANYAYGELRRAPFHLVGPEGLEQFFQGLVSVFGHWIVPTGDRLQLTELTRHAPIFNCLDRISVRSACTAHSESGRAYRIEADEVSAVITGDTDVCREITELARGADILVSECSMPDERKVKKHLTPSEAGRIAREAGVGKLVLTHFYPPCEDVDVAAQAGVEFSGEIVKARDLMVLTIE